MDVYIVDVFAEAKYQGNQLAVLIPDHSLKNEEMLQIAKEMHFSETSFILSGKQENGGYDVRIFTPDVEVPFAGHPTLGTAAIINHVMEDARAAKVYLNLRVGQIPVEIAGDMLIMKQNQPEFRNTIEDYQMVADAVGIDVAEICMDYPVQQVSTGLPCTIVPLKSLDAVERCQVNHSKFRAFLDAYGYCNFLVFASEEQGQEDLRVRVFMDDTGFFEDPATGSASGNLAAYLLEYSFFANKQLSFMINQGIEMGRPSQIEIKARQDSDFFHIQVGGKVQLISKGTWF